MLEYLWIVPLLPLLGAAVNGLFGAKWPNRIVSGVAIGSTGLSFLGAIEAVREFFDSGQALFHKPFFTWIAAGNFRAGFDLQMDQLTVVMVLVVTGVGWLIHIYATGYMAHEGGYYRFFSYLNLFMFFMLILMLAANYVLLFVGWEGVGLSSYLLKPKSPMRGKKHSSSTASGTLVSCSECFCFSRRLARWILYSFSRRPIRGLPMRWATLVRSRLPACFFLWVRAENRRNCRYTFGCRMPWKGPLRLAR
jgi:hypothetical protein